MCGDRATDVDHIIELAAGGTNTIDNVQPLCKPCHIAKTSSFNATRPTEPHRGVFSARVPLLAIRRNAVPLFGKSISQALMLKLVENNVKTIYIALDNDALKDSINHCEKLLNLGKEVYLVELSGKDPSDMGFEQFTKLLHKSTKLTFSELFAKKVELTYG
jgi:hypothetical protein